jgi:hypothetical protein
MCQHRASMRELCGNDHVLYHKNDFLKIEQSLLIIPFNAISQNTRNKLCHPTYFILVVIRLINYKRMYFLNTF